MSWLRGDANRWKTYVANRVHEIQRMSDKNDWLYANTKESGDDCASRGLLPDALMRHDLWWNGLEFLTNDIDEQVEINYETEQEKKQSKK